MECFNCGCLLSDSDEICPECGTELIDDAVEDEREFPRYKALSTLKSPLFIATAAFWALSLVLCVGYFIFLFESGGGFLDSFETLTGISVKNGTWTKVVVGIVAIVVVVPFFLKSLGLIIMAVKARSGSCAGTGVFKAGVIFSFVTGILEALLIVGGAVIWGIFQRGGENNVIVFCVSCSLIVIVFVFILVYYAKLLSAFEIIRDAVEQNKCSEKASLFAVFMSFFVAILMLLLAMTQWVAETVDALTWVNIAFIGIYSVSYFLLGIVLLMCRRIEISDGMPDEYRTISYYGRESATMTYVAEPVASRCRKCGRILRTDGTCVCEISIVNPSSMTETVKKPVRRCENCGKLLGETEICYCLTKPAGDLDAPTYSSEISGSPRDVARKAPISNPATSGFFNSGGDLD